jgi:uncharacterized ferredoxin-like protein
MNNKREAVVIYNDYAISVYKQDDIYICTVDNVDDVEIAFKVNSLDEIKETAEKAINKYTQSCIDKNIEVKTSKFCNIECPIELGVYKRILEEIQELKQTTNKNFEMDNIILGHMISVLCEKTLNEMDKFTNNKLFDDLQENKELN